MHEQPLVSLCIISTLLLSSHAPTSFPRRPPDRVHNSFECFGGVCAILGTRSSAANRLFYMREYQARVQTWKSNAHGDELFWGRFTECMDGELKVSAGLNVSKHVSCAGH